MDDTTSTTAADGGSFARSLSTGLEVRPTDFLDGWWLHEAAMADHSEFTYAFRHTALGELEPTTLDELLPEGAEVVRRAFFTSAKKQELVVAYEETLVAMSVESSFLWLAVAARDAKHAAYVKTKGTAHGGPALRSRVVRNLRVGRRSRRVRSGAGADVREVRDRADPRSDAPRAVGALAGSTGRSS